MEYETKTVTVKWKPGVFHGLQPDSNGCARAVEQMAREGWVLISQTDHGGLIGFAHTKLIFRKITPTSY